MGSSLHAACPPALVTALGGALVALALAAAPAAAAGPAADAAPDASLDAPALDATALDATALDGAALSPDGPPDRAERKGKKSSSNSKRKGSKSSSSSKKKSGDKSSSSKQPSSKQPSSSSERSPPARQPTELGRPARDTTRPSPTSRPTPLDRPGPDSDRVGPQRPGPQSPTSSERVRPDGANRTTTGPGLPDRRPGLSPSQAPDRDQARIGDRTTATDRPSAGDRTGPSAASGRTAQERITAQRGVQSRVRHPDTRIGRPGPSPAAGRPTPQVHTAPARHAVTARDHRYARPRVNHVVHHQQHVVHHVSHAPPRRHWYRAWHSHYWVHPWYRWTHATVAAVWFGFTVHAWVDTWAPPHRPGWTWVSGHWEYGWWVPGYWAPTRTVYVYRNMNYTYVPGWWVGDVYIEGYYRPQLRDDGSDWVWVDGYYLEDGTYIWGHWVPAGNAPAGYVWVPGFWDGEVWVGGFWRPQARTGYVWVAPFYDQDGIFNAGYWEPTVAQAGQVWIPGWFDGTQWVQGYWVSDAEYQSEDPAGWDAPDGWDAGWEDSAADDVPTYETMDELPLAIPVDEGEPAPMDGGPSGDAAGDAAGSHAPPPRLGEE